MAGNPFNSVFVRKGSKIRQANGGSSDNWAVFIPLVAPTP